MGAMPREKKRERRSDCPVNVALEIFGDKWSLLIIRDMIFGGAKTYGDFLKSDEGIATNILAARLALLECEGIIRKAPHAADKRKDIYLLTDKGIDLIPILLEINIWSVRHDASNTWALKASDDAMTRMRKAFLVRLVRAKDKKKIIEEIKKTIRKGGAFFAPQ